MIPIRRSAARTLGLAAAMIGAVTLTACGDKGSDADADAAVAGASDETKIGLLLPESKTTRYESFDRPYFEDKIAELSPDTEIVYANADQDAAKQQQQAEAALTEGVDVLVLDPVDSSAAASIVVAAKAQGVPVIAYDRFINDAPIDYYISFDNELVGELQATALLEQIEASGTTGGILMINGSPTDNNATLFKAGAHSVIDDSGYEVLAEFDTPDWSPDQAQNWMAGQLTQFTGQVAGIYAANDGTAGGAIAAMKAANVDPLPPITGQDAELAAIQRIIAGDQYMTVYKAIKPEAEQAAELAVALLNGETPAGDTEVEGIPSFLLEPVAVTQENIADTIIADEFYTVSDICTADYADACAAIGLS